MPSYNSKILVTDLAVGTLKVVAADDAQFLVCRTATAVYVIENRCPHAGLPLTGARIRGEHIFCPHHGARFQLSDGRSASTVTAEPLHVFPVKIVDDEIQIELP